MAVAPPQPPKKRFRGEWILPPLRMRQQAGSFYLSMRRDSRGASCQRVVFVTGEDVAGFARHGMKCCLNPAPSRAQLPTNVFGLLFHTAEYAQRHTGAIITTAKVVRALNEPQVSSFTVGLVLGKVFSTLVCFGNP